MLNLHFPQNFKQHVRYPELVTLVESITNHKAMLVQKKQVLDNMIRASLIFTVCFYANTLSLLYFALQRLKENNALSVQKNTESIHLFLELASGELATRNIPNQQNSYSPH